MKPDLPHKAKVDRILEDVNKARRLLGAPPLRALLKGRRNEANSCPVARSVAHGLEGSSVEVDGDEVFAYMRLSQLQRIVCRMPLNPATRDFIRWFDLGQWPGMELTP